MLAHARGASAENDAPCRASRIRDGLMHYFIATGGHIFNIHDDVGFFHRLPAELAPELLSTCEQQLAKIVAKEAPSPDDGELIAGLKNSIRRLRFTNLKQRDPP